MLKLITTLLTSQVTTKFCADADGSEDGDFGANCPGMAVYPQLDMYGLWNERHGYKPDQPGVRFDRDGGYTLGEFPG